MNPEHLARGWALIAEGAQYLSMAYASNDAPASLPVASPAAGSPPPAAGPSFDELPPEGFGVGPVDEIPMKPQVDAGLGKCPVHGKPWSVKPAGVGAKGAYDAFWRCADKNDDDSWCKQKPQKIWRDLHPLPTGAAA